MVMLPLAQILSGLKCSQMAAATKTGLFIVPELDWNPHVKQISKIQSEVIIFPPPSLSNCHLYFHTQRASVSLPLCACVCTKTTPITSATKNMHKVVAHSNMIK